MRPVAPPTRAIGRYPYVAANANAFMIGKCPTCRDAAVGSNPAYTAVEWDGIAVACRSILRAFNAFIIYQIN